MSAHQPLNRRHFLARLGAAGALVTAGMSPNTVFAETEKVGKRLATDRVPLGQSGVKLCRLGMGTGSNGGSVQRKLSQEAFTKMIRHGIDRGVTFIDTADNYQEMHERVREAIRGVDRETIQIQCKIPYNRYKEPLKEIDRFRKEVGTDYFDTFLIHCVLSGNWPEEEKKLRDLLDEAKEKQIIRATGVSIHGLIPLKATVECDWGDMRLVRINHNGMKMDGPRGDWNETGDVEAVVAAMRAMRAQGKGIIGMKLIGNGNFTNPQDRQKAADFVMGLDCVDSVVIGFKSPAEIDEAIERLNKGLAKADAAARAEKGL